MRVLKEITKQEKWAFLKLIVKSFFYFAGENDYEYLIFTDELATFSENGRELGDYKVKLHVIFKTVWWHLFSYKFLSQYFRFQ